MTTTAMRGPTVSYVLPYKKDKFHKFGVNKLLLSSRDYDDDNARLYSSGRDSTVRVWDLKRPMNFNTDINQRSTTTTATESGINEYRKMDDQTVPEVVFIGSQHSDWVNDMVMLNGGHKMISCSNDNTVMLWDMEPGSERHLRTYRHHIDYCKCLAYSAQGNFFVSGGFDNSIALWDLETMQMCIASKTRYTPAKFKPQKNSVYSLAVEPMGRVLVSGSTDKFIRLFDPRSREKKMKLRGHQDMVKSVLINDDATMVVSASGDGTVKTWDLRQQRCFHTYHVHRDSVWTLAFDHERGQDYVVSGGRDKNVHYIDTKRNEVCHLLRAEHPVLSLAITPNRDYVWVSTTGSKIKKWHFKRKLESIKPKKIAKSSTSGSFTRLGASPLRSGDHRPLSRGPLNYPVTCIPGSPGILRHHILNDRRRVLALDSEGYVTLWDIARGHLEADYGKTNFDEKVEALFQYCSIPNWFSIERKTGSLEIVLEPLSVFNAEIYASDAGFNVIHEEDKINLGAMVIKALFSDWFAKRRARIWRTKNMYMEQQHAQRNAEIDHESEEQEEEGKSGEMMRDDETDTADVDADVSNVENGPGNDDNDNGNNDDNEMNDVQDEPKSPQAGEEGNHEKNSSDMNDTHTSDSPELAPHAVANSSATEISYEEIQERELYHFTLPGSTSVIVHHEKLNPTLAPFKKMLKDINGSEIEYRAIPRWIVDTLQQRDIQPTSAQKIGFFLEPYDPNDLPHFKDSKSKLTAHRILKIRKVCQFVVQNLQLKLPTVREWKHEQQKLQETRKRTRSDSVSSSNAVPAVRKRHGDTLAQRFSNITATIVNKVSKSPSQHDDDSLPATPDNSNAIPDTSHQTDQQQGNIGDSASSLQQQQQAEDYQETEDLSERLVAPEQYIEILCNGRALSPTIDLGTVNSFFKGSQRTIIMQYRKRREKE